MLSKTQTSAIKFVAVFCLLSVSLFFHSTLSWSVLPHYLESFLRIAEACFGDLKTQWLIFLSLYIYFIIFLLVRLHARGFSLSITDPNVWLSCTLLINMIVYGFNYSSSVRSLILVGAAVLGQIVVACSSQKVNDSIIGRVIDLRVLFLSILVFLLVLSSVWQVDTGQGFEYYGHVRWSGPWDTPNIAGLLMGTGLSLAVALGIGSWEIEVEKLRVAHRNWKFKLRKYFCAVLCLIAAIITGRGLLHSYSRGAWVATLCGCAYSFANTKERDTRVESGKRKVEIGRSSCISWFQKNWILAFVIFISILALVFWQFNHSGRSVIVDRIFSTAEVNDFSWRNRIAAWEGALQITGEHPWFGVGWNCPDQLYGYYYLPPKLDEYGAFEMNDYLMLGVTLGVTALVCFGMYIWLSLMQESGVRSQESGIGKAESENQKSGMELHWLQMTCRAGAIVLAVGFWFDGGLFKLATASVFWILLELGQEVLPPTA
jgi:hypothetical protein